MRRTNKEGKMSRSRTELAIKVGGASMCELLKSSDKIEMKTLPDGSMCANSIGFSSTIDFIVKTLAENTDSLLEELLILAPALHTYSEFLKKMPIYEVTKEELEAWIEKGSVV
jgi:hypothetical protein